jgi:hypothetical protein
MIEYKSAFQLEALIADLAGFDENNVQVTKIGNTGDFRAGFVGTPAAVNVSRAKADVDSACNKLKTKYRLIR